MVEKELSSFSRIETFNMSQLNTALETINGKIKYFQELVDECGHPLFYSLEMLTANSRYKRLKERIEDEILDRILLGQEA